jgi:hypothetical protein
MPEPSPPLASNLQLAAGRLRRTQWVWAALLGAAALLQWLSLRGGTSTAGALDVAALAVAAGLLALSVQPAYLALVAVLWGSSLIRLVPGVAQAFGPDILVGVLGNSWLEIAAAALVRIVLMVTAWNQFMLYRLLYGTAEFTGGEQGAAPIPEVIPNRTDRLAGIALLVASFGLLGCLISIPLGNPLWQVLAAHAALVLGTYAIGLGLGAAFSPTRRRAAALWATALGALAILAALTLGAWSLR